MSRLASWFDAVVLDLGRQMRWSFLPPLMVYFAYGASGITSIVGTFFIKDYLDVSAAFVAGLAFWAGLPWALKMPMGHLTDLLWRWKWLLVFAGAALITASLLIMYGLATRVPWMGDTMSVTAWFVIAALLAPGGYVVQDAVADALSVEAVPEGEREQILEIVEALPKEMALVLIEHDMDLVFRFAKTISVLVQGALFVEGPASEVARDPRVRQVYLGESEVEQHLGGAA